MSKRITSPRFIALVTLLALLVSVFLPFFATYNLPEAGSRQELSSVFGERVLICTAEGFRWVDAADIEKGDVPVRHKDAKCPVCVLAAHQAERAPAALAVTYQLSSRSDAHYAAAEVAFVPQHSSGHYHTRAPPAFI